MPDGSHREQCRDNLPTEVNRFIGRSSELAQLRQLLTAHRLLTLVGPGGVGKTRLALRLGIERPDRFAHGVRFVDVAHLAEPGEVPQAVADALEVRARRGQSWCESVATRLRSDALLLILDGCEPQLAACAVLAQELLRQCPRVHILVTSRAPLGIAEESLWRVPPLSLPGKGTRDVRLLGRSESVQLFLDRATAMLPGFGLTTENARDVRRICRGLDGIPLALELVAGHVGTLGLAELARRVGADLSLSLSGRRDAPARQQTLQATLDWSYALLSADERQLLRRLAVFVGNWTLDDAQAVCSDAVLTAPSVAALIKQLCEKSLVLHMPGGANNNRYRLLHVTRHYAFDKLVESGELGWVAGRHLRWFVTLAERVPPEVLDARHAAGLDDERSNLRAALSWAVCTGEAELGLRLALAATPMWFMSGRYAEGDLWIRRLLDMQGGPTTQSIQRAARVWRAELLVLQGDYAAAERLLDSVLHEQVHDGSQAEVGLCTLFLGNVALWRGQMDRARSLFSRALTQLTDAGSSAADFALFQSATVAVQTGDRAGANAFADHLWQIGHARPQPVAVGRVQAIRAALAADEGEFLTALEQFRSAESLQRLLGDLNGMVDSLIYHGQVLLITDRLSDARAKFEQAARVLSGTGDRMRLARTIDGVAQTLATTHPEVTVRLIAATAEMRARLGAVPWPRDTQLTEKALGFARAAVGPETYAHAWQLGASMLESDVFALALSPEMAIPASITGELTPLTPRERQVVRLVASGGSPAEISEQLVISRATARKHLEHAMAKLGLHSRVQLATWAADHLPTTVH